MSVGAHDVLAAARAAFAEHPEALARIETEAERLSEPLRVAVVGMVKSGKSTLLNALLGEEVAATDTGECTRIVTWFRRGDTARVEAHLLTGEIRPLAVRRHGGLTFDLGGVTAGEVSHIVVDWPSEVLSGITLIDTPGVGSVSTDVSRRAHDFLLPEGAPATADVVVYVTRHPHETDLALLGELRDASAGLTTGASTVVVLGRADEFGAGRIDSMLAARSIAARYAQDPAVSALSLNVTPVAGLLAQGARTLRQSEFEALRLIAALDREQRERILVSADRFVARGPELPLSRADRSALLDRFGLFGIRLACVLISNGAETAPALARELSRRSGIDDVASLLQGRMRTRAEFLKADAALALAEALVADHPGTATGELEGLVERVRAGAHDLQELRLLARLSSSPLPSAERAAAARLLGGAGTAPAERLGLPDGTTAELASAAHAAAAHWRAVAEAPDSGPELVRSALLLVRSAEGAIAELNGESEPPAPLTLAPEPGSGGRQHPDNERRAS